MKIPTLIQLAREQAKFVKYQDGNLWYQIIWTRPITISDAAAGVSYESSEPVIFDFPIPVNDAGGGEFGKIMKPLELMRWSRKEIERLTAEQQMIMKAKEEWELEQATLTTNRSD